MCSAVVVVIEVSSEGPLQVPIMEHDHVVEALPTYRADDSFTIWILSRRQLHPIATMRVELFG